MKINEAILQFLEHCELDRNLSQKTIKMYGYYLIFFKEWLLKKNQKSKIKNQKEENFQVENITEETIRQFRLYLSREYINPFKGEL
ncbi:MAG: hypothetical protein ACK4NT_07980, partial [Candidatus Omnitrophota bacterium]